MMSTKTMTMPLFALLTAMSLVSTANAVAYEVASCAELAGIDDTTVTEITVTSPTIECSDYTRFRVRNVMTLSATVPDVTFSNVSFKVLGELTVQPNVVMKDVGLTDDGEEKNGGTLYVQEGATATFMGTAGFYNNTVTKAVRRLPVEDGRFSIQLITKKGGALHNKGALVFEKDATFDNNRADSRGSTSVNKGGAISNAASGSITFKEKLIMNNNEAEGFFAGQGGGIYNRGDILVEGESIFTDNTAAEGGVIYQDTGGSVTFNSMASFVDNYCTESRGGAIFSFGGVLVMNAGSLFDDNTAASSGDGGSGGGIYAISGADLTLAGTTTFRSNWAYVGAGIFLKLEQRSVSSTPDYESPTLTLPTEAADLIFEDNSAEMCPQIAYAFSDGIRCEL